jgi:1,2-phenylacetyl-CoA epoxidase PaaB subunit
LNYNFLEVFLVTPTSAIRETFPVVFSQEVPKRDLRHVGLSGCDEKKGLTMSREVYELRQGERRLVSRDSQWRLIGLSDVFDFAKNKKHELYSWSQHLLNWHAYS